MACAVDLVFVFTGGGCCTVCLLGCCFNICVWCGLLYEFVVVCGVLIVCVVLEG